MRGSRGLAAVLLGLWGLAAGCGRCSPPSSLQDTRPGSELDGGQEEDGGIPASELGWIQPLNTRLFQLAGEKDVGNRYPFAVMVKTRAPMEAGVKGECSGVLLSPNLVLTAGHCVCVQRKAVLPDDRVKAIIDGSECSKKAVIVLVDYDSSSASGAVLTTRTQTLRGDVQPHPRLKVAIDGQGQVLSSEADLATIVLSERLQEKDFPVLTDAEIDSHELVVVVSYGYDEVLGGMDGQRRFKTFKVGTVSASVDGRVTFEQPSRELYKGDSGGPVLSVRDGKLRLAGISTAGLGREATLVSVYFYRDWLMAELARAKALR